MSKIDTFRETLHTLFPGLDLTPLSYGSKVKDTPIWNHHHFIIPPENSNLVGSPYFFDKKSFVHFTSFHAFSSILNERAIRLYNLHKLDDPREFTFASRIFQLNQEIIDDAKDNLFLISFCERAILNPIRSKDEFNMWRLYGLQGKGVGIIFSLKNNPIQWRVMG